MEDTKRPTPQEQEEEVVVAALESLSALEGLLDALTAKVEDFDRHLCMVEALLEKTVAGRY